MSAFVLDASVGIKWFIPEVHSADALRLRHPNCQLRVPAFFDVEIANILWKKANRGEITRDEAEAFLQISLLLPVTRHPDSALLATAFDLAIRTQRTVYDCMYLALAARTGCQMVTADEKLRNALAGSPLASLVCWIEDIP
jgi:predicted nucleic acid-binding protein